MDDVIRAMEFIHKKSRLVYKLLEGVLGEQRRLREEGFPREVEEFKLDRPNDWRMIQDLRYCHQTTIKHPKETFDTRMMAELLKMRLPKDEQHRGKLVKEAEKLANEAQEACRGFKENVGSWFQVAEKFYTIFGNRNVPERFISEERRVWRGYLRVCSAALAADGKAAVIQAVDTRFNLFQEPVDKFKETKIGC